MAPEPQRKGPALPASSYRAELQNDNRENVREIRLERQARVAGEMRRLYDHGFALIPLGGKDGKKPLISGWNNRRLPFDACLNRMVKAGSLTYGIRLDGFLVVDCDTDNEATQALLAERFPASPFVVRTGRGSHHYYRHNGPVPPPIRDPDVTIEFKAGLSAFAVGPCSVRPDGKVYVAESGDITMDLPLFVDRCRAVRVALAGTGKVPVGSRNPMLVKRVIEYAPFADGLDGLIGDLLAVRNIEFDDPASFPDSEVVKLAEWAWNKRLENRIWAGRNSTVQINRMALDALLPLEGGPDAFALYSIVVSNHGHLPGKAFAIVPDGMLAAGLLQISRRQIYRARDLLTKIGLLVLVQRGRMKQPNLYRLQNPLLALSQQEGRGRGVYSLTLVSPVAHRGEISKGVKK
jgi:Bifunctional DNA primase/polymerase, N-terminal